MTGTRDGAAAESSRRKAPAVRRSGRQLRIAIAGFALITTFGLACAWQRHHNLEALVSGYERIGTVRGVDFWARLLTQDGTDWLQVIALDGDAPLCNGMAPYRGIWEVVPVPACDDFTQTHTLLAFSAQFPGRYRRYLGTERVPLFVLPAPSGGKWPIVVAVAEATSNRFFSERPPG